MKNIFRKRTKVKVNRPFTEPRSFPKKASLKSAAQMSCAPRFWDFGRGLACAAIFGKWGYQIRPDTPQSGSILPNASGDTEKSENKTVQKKFLKKSTITSLLLGATKKAWGATQKRTQVCLIWIPISKFELFFKSCYTFPWVFALLWGDPDECCKI